MGRQTVFLGLTYTPFLFHNMPDELAAVISLLASTLQFQIKFQYNWNKLVFSVFPVAASALTEHFFP